jgi:Arc/MetJ family transcription regulator
MRITIDGQLLQRAMKTTGAKSKSETVRLALQTLVRIGNQSSLSKLRGKIDWKGDIDAWRRD